MVVDWDWNAGTGPTGGELSKSGSSWSVGAATKGPADGKDWLATNPGGNYTSLANDWVQLPTVDLSAYGACKLRVTVDLWRDCETVGLVNYDGGNLQFTTDPDPKANSAWAQLGGAQMGYDGELLGSCGNISCLVEGQQSWASSGSPKAKTGVFEAASPPGATLALRFTFFSDDMGTKPGIYVRRLLVEAY